MDLVLPVGSAAPPAALATLLEGSVSKVVGAGALPSAASLAGDCTALTARLSALGFPTLPLLRLRLADFEGLEEALAQQAQQAQQAQGAEQAQQEEEPASVLHQTKAYRAVADW